ncbi:MAG: Rid family hydrolase [Myxococcales bacterium]
MIPAQRGGRSTHDSSYSTFAMQCPDVRLERGVRFVDEGGVASAGGLTSGIDLALHVVERYFGRDAANGTADYMEYHGQGWLDARSNGAYARPPTAAAGHAICPVCWMELDPAGAPKSFCSTEHKQDFDVWLGGPGRVHAVARHALRRGAAARSCARDRGGRVICLLTGFFARAAAAVMFVYLVLVSVMLHDFWSAPPASAGMMQTHFLKNIAIAGGLLMLAACGPGRWSLAGEQPGKTIVIPAGEDRAYDDWHYAPAVRVGDMVIVSGLPAGKGDTYEAKVRNMFERLKRTLAAAGADLSDVVELTTFHAEARDTEGFRKEFAEFSKIHHEYFPSGYPAWTAVGTTALLSAGAPLEMRVVAVVGSGKRTEVKRAKAP